jgi:hypothetical protein
MRERLYNLAELSPRSAILELWLLVESAAYEALERNDIKIVECQISPAKIGKTPSFDGVKSLKNNCRGSRILLASSRSLEGNLRPPAPKAGAECT